MTTTQAVVAKLAAMALLLALTVMVNEAGMRYGRKSWQRIVCRALAAALLAALCAVALAGR